MAQDLPPAPTLMSPANNAMVVDTSVTFVWESIPGATSYILIVNTVDSPLSGTRKFSGYVGGTQYTDTGYPNNGIGGYGLLAMATSLPGMTLRRIAVASSMEMRLLRQP